MNESEISKLRHEAGTGHWKAFRALGMDVEAIFTASKKWKEKLNGLKQGWLCWNVDADWCLVQQRLVESVGWTPVVGFDPRVGPPPTTESAILINFSEDFDLPVMYPHFPLEFMHLYIDKLATWHSDVLLPEWKMKEIAGLFEDLPDGKTYVTQPGVNRKHPFNRRKHRYWELVACTTATASRDQFIKGAGWWKSFADHINCPSEGEYERRKKYYWDHGAGIWYWDKFCKGQTRIIRSDTIKQWHYTKIGKKDFVRSAPIDQNAKRNMAVDLRRNFDLVTICEDLNLTKFLERN